MSIMENAPVRTSGGAEPHRIAKATAERRAVLYVELQKSIAASYGTACTEVNEDGAQIDWTTDDEVEAELISSLCEDCPVLSLCKQYAELGEEAGVWGGTTEAGRRRAKRRERKRAARERQSVQASTQGDLLHDDAGLDECEDVVPAEAIFDAVELIFDEFVESLEDAQVWWA